MNVEELRKSGYKVRVYHGRGYKFWETSSVYLLDIMSRREFEHKYPDMNFGRWVDSEAGFTTVEITTPEGETLKGKFNVPAGKQFDRKLGLKVAIARAFAVVEKNNKNIVNAFFN